jgi:hypothetical protein
MVHCAGCRRLSEEVTRLTISVMPHETGCLQRGSSSQPAEVLARAAAKIMIAAGGSSSSSWAHRPDPNDDLCRSVTRARGGGVGMFESYGAPMASSGGAAACSRAAHGDMLIGSAD